MAETSQNSGDKETPTGFNLPITMKVDAPPEEANKEEEDNIKNQNSSPDEFKICSPSNRPPSVATNPFTNNKLSRGILKPPQLSLNNSSKPGFVLNPSRLNPKSTPSDDKKSTNSINGEVPKFVPLIQSQPKSNATTTHSATSSSGSFIFGQNLEERVATGANNSDEPKPSTSLNSNGTTDMLFSNAIKNENKPDSNSTSSKEAKSLSESAREYEESRANKRKYEEVEIITGEEGETNILNTTCKLFAFDKVSGSWQERGRGVLRLNDLDGNGHMQSRLVFRTTGSLRVVLNTIIWAEMTVERASEKSVRFTALDANGIIRVFLAMASIDDSKQLYSQIQQRVQKEIQAHKHKKHNPDQDSSSN